MANPFKQNIQNSQNVVNNDISILQNMKSPQEAMNFLNGKTQEEQWNILCALCQQKGINPYMFFGNRR